MGTYKPTEGDDATSVDPLLQFFELVHIGDTIQSMIQVYFDKELVNIVFPRSSRVSSDLTLRSFSPHISTRLIS